MKKNGAEIFVEVLKHEGVEHIFGFPGGAVLHAYDAIHKQSDIQHICVRHEQGAVHAADGYARASGKPGVALVTSGPGATNTVTGIATAYMDSIPLVVFTGQVSTPLIGNDAFQEADIVGITRPCTKHNILVKDTRELAQSIREAFHIATHGRPGPVLVDLPKDVLMEDVSFSAKSLKEKVTIRGYQPTYKGHPGQIARAAKMLSEAKRPTILMGGGVIISEAHREVKELAESTATPVASTLMGLGGFPGTSDLFLGMVGMHGTYRANMALTHNDLILAIGARFDDRVTGKLDEFASGAKIIHVDIDPTSISKNISVHLPIVGDSRNVMKKMITEIGKIKKKWAIDHKAWLDQIKKWKSTYPLAYDTSGDEIKPQYVVEQIYKLTKGKAIIATEVGQNQMWTAQYYLFDNPRSFLTSGGLGTMGYGFPAAIGAQVAFPDSTVVDIAGDGSIQMNIQEMITAVQYGLPVKVAILNNRFLGMVRQWQELFFDKRYSHTCLQCSPDFVKLAEAYGAVGLRATKPEEVVPVLKKAFRTKKPVIMDFVVSREENVYPMVPAGAPINNMLLV
jgi:acetolactate synthase-1/2/3 large subunit